MSRTCEKVASGTHLLKCFRHRWSWALSNQMIGAHLYEDGKDIHLGSGNPNCAEDITHTVDNLTIMLEMILNVAAEIHFRS